MMMYREWSTALLPLLLLILAAPGCKSDASNCQRDADCQSGQQCSSGGDCITVNPNPNNTMSGDMGSNNTASPVSDMSGNNNGMCDAGQLACGARCCPQGFACDDGRCTCSADKLCQGICCGEQQSCELGQCVDPCDGARCGASLELCCTDGDICINGGCATPGAACEFNEQCNDGEVCEPLVGQCVPKPAERCEYRPPVGEFTPVIGCEWRPDGLPYPDRGDVVAAPIVMDLADEGEEDGFFTPEIAFVSFNRRADGCCNTEGTIRIVSGKCDGQEVRTIASIDDFQVNNDVGIAAGDLDGDGVPEIVAVANKNRIRQSDMATIYYPEGLVAFKRSVDDGSKWEVLWFNENYPSNNIHVNGGPTISIANLDGQGNPEVILGSLAFNGATGELLWDGTAYITEGKLTGQGHNVFGPVSSVLDVEQDGKMEVFAGNTLYNHDGSVRWQFSFDSQASSCRFGANNRIDCDGYNGVVDLEGDGDPELISVRLGEIWVIDALTETLDWKVEIPVEDCVDNNGNTRNEAGPPTVADFDGDGRPEIGTAGADYYVVADLDCDVDDWAERGCHSRAILWVTPNQDCSSRSTASSVFDFEGDGAAEVVYVDETTFRILSGKDGSILFESDDHQSNTRIELPVIADVDNDDNAEVIVASAWGNRLAEEFGERGKSGLRIWQDAEDNWVRTRRVWNQHSYHVTNISEEGIVPVNEPANWTIGSLNNYRQNVQPLGLFDAPDLVVRDLRVGADLCGLTGRLDVYLLLGNDGALGVPDGVGYSVYAIQGDRRELIAQGETDQRLLPGQTLSLTFQWDTPQEFQGGPFSIEATFDTEEEHRECEEENNQRVLDGVECALQG